MDTNSQGQNTLFSVLSHNLETQIIQTLWHVPAVRVSTGLLYL